MKGKVALMILSVVSTTVFAQSTIFHRNIPVLQNGDPARCAASWTGRVNQEDVVRYGAGENQNLSGPVIRSCVGCAMKSNGGNTACVCSRCYDYFQ